MDYRCFFCFSRAFEKLIKKEKLTESQANQFTKEIIRLYSEKSDEYLTPQFAAAMYTKLKDYSGDIDPFFEIKKQSNDLVLSLYDGLKEKINKSGDPFDVALRLAIAGNIIDFAVYDQYNLQETIDMVLSSDFALNDSIALKEELEGAKSILYLGDNNGELVLDKLFIETINHPNLTYAVRGEPIINDVTLDDAKYVGLNRLVPVISNGTNYPSTIIHECSEEFQEAFHNADLIISKGQGNLEGLMYEPFYNIFFLLMVKCDVIANKLEVNKGDFVIKKNHLIYENSNSKWKRGNWKDTGINQSFQHNKKAWKTGNAG